MEEYDPQESVDPVEWLEMDEGERILLALEYHRRARVKLPNARVHATIHAIVETQIAMGDEIPVRGTLERLQAEGLDRHEAVHAIGSVLAERMFEIMKQGGAAEGSGDPNEALWAGLRGLTAESWRESR